MTSSSPIIPDPPIVRRTAKFHPSIWGDIFSSYISDETTLTRWREKAEVLKGEVQKMFGVDEALDNTLCLIDDIQRLGISYHFEEEIEQELVRVFEHLNDPTQDHDEENLSLVSLRFRLLREHGYNIRSDVFKVFIDDKGNLKEAIKEDVNGILSLYEASHLKIHGEEILDLALSSTTTRLRSMLAHLNPVYTRRVLHALNHPINKGLSRLDSVSYFSIYNELEHSNETLLEFAKLDFNIVQKLHQQELSTLSKWWKDLDLASKLPFVRDRLVEGYFWILGVYFEPRYSLSRMFLAQIFAMTSIVDDIYDAYGTKEELYLFTEAIDRWDESAVTSLPEYMKVYYQVVLEVYCNMEKEMAQQGKPSYGLEYSKKAMKCLVRSYYEQTKWVDRDELPTIEEYMEVGLVSSGYPMIAMASFVGIDDAVKEEAFEWLLKGPKINEASALIARLMNDIVSHEFERERGHSPTAVECFMREHRVSKDEAREALKKKVAKAWEDVNEGMIRPTSVSRALLMRILNLCRVITVLYKESDGYTHVNAMVKEHIVSMFSTATQV